MVKKQPLSLKARAINASEDAPAEPQKLMPTKVAADAGVEPIKRLTLDMPQSLHTKLKMMAIEEGTTMANMIRRWLEKQVK